jgi:hypothetical protein
MRRLIKAARGQQHDRKTKQQQRAAKSASFTPRPTFATKTEPQKPRVYALNGAYAAEVEFNRNPAGLLRTILNAAEAESLSELAVDLAIAPSEEWLNEYLESALQLFGFEQSAAQVQVSFAASMQTLNREYPPVVRSFAASVRLRAGVPDWASLFEE